MPFRFEEFVVRTSPSIVLGGEKDIYLVLDDFGRLGKAWRETDEAGTNRATLVRNLLDGQYENPVRIVAFNTAEGWCRDVTVDIADESSFCHVRAFYGTYRRPLRSEAH
jgi:hypothetical protein